MRILTSCESEHNAATATIQSSVKVMSQSTIYNRNMARRRITATLQDDPRSPAIRVMSGLPVLRAIFPPYVPKVDARLPSPPVSEPTPSDISMLLGNGDVCTFHSVTASSRPTRNHGTLLAIAAPSAVGGILSEAYRCKGLTGTRVLATTVSPFSGKSIVLAPAGLQLVGWHQPLPVPSWRAIPVVLPGAVHISLLFTVKEVVAGHFEKELSPSVQPVSMTTLVSSTIAGAVLSVVRPWKPAQGSFLTASPSPLRGGQVLGATAYFTTYEALKLMLSPLAAHSGETRQQTHWTAIALAGAVAGTVYESILLPSRALGITGRWAQVACRAAPTHALMFLGYEATRDVLAATRT